MPHQNFPTSFGPFTSAYNAMSLLPPPPVTMISTSPSIPQLIPVTGIGHCIFPSSNVLDLPPPPQLEKQENNLNLATSPVHKDIPEQEEPEVQ